jgi:hypothetical protein
MFYSIKSKIDQELTTFVNWEHIFTSFSVRHRGATLHQNQKIYLQLIEKVLVSSIFILIYSYLPVIDSSIPTEGEGYNSPAISPASPTFYTHNPLKLTRSVAKWSLDQCSFFLLFNYNSRKYFFSRRRYELTTRSGRFQLIRHENFTSYFNS